MRQLPLPGLATMVTQPAWHGNPAIMARLKCYLRGFLANGREIFASRRYLADKLGIAVRTLARYLAALVADGFMATVRRSRRSAVRHVSPPAQFPIADNAADSDTTRSFSAPLAADCEASGMPSGPSCGPSYPYTQVKPVGKSSTSAVSSVVEEPVDDASPIAEAAKKASGFEQLSESDLRYLKAVEKSGSGPQQVRAGILLGRARKLVSDANRGVSQTIQSIRYFASTIREAPSLAPGYVDHLEAFVKRYA